MFRQQLDFKGMKSMSVYEKSKLFDKIIETLEKDTENNSNMNILVQMSLQEQIGDARNYIVPRICKISCHFDQFNRILDQQNCLTSPKILAEHLISGNLEENGKQDYEKLLDRQIIDPLVDSLNQFFDPTKQGKLE